MRASVGAGVDRICMRPLFDRMVRVSLIRNEPAVWLDLAWQYLGRAQSCRRGTQTGPSSVTVVTGLPAVSARFDGTAAAGTLAHQAEADVGGLLNEPCRRRSIAHGHPNVTLSTCMAGQVARRPPQAAQPCQVRRLGSVGTPKPSVRHLLRGAWPSRPTRAGRRGRSQRGPTPRGVTGRGRAWVRPPGPRARSTPG